MSFSLNLIFAAIYFLMITTKIYIMKKSYISIPAFLLTLILSTTNGNTQENIAWMSDFTSEIIAGSYTYSYNFYTLEDECKIKIEEKKTNKKGSETIQSYIVYLSDISPSSLSFKSSGKVLVINMETIQSQKFIGQYEGDEFSGYTNEISIYTSEVDKARSMIDAILSHIETCKDNERSWTSTEEAFNWLTENIGESSISGSTYQQKFGKAAKSYLAFLESETTDSKGQQKLDHYTFDLSDIESDGMKLVVSGKALKIHLPVRDKKNYIQVKTNNTENSYARDLNIHVDDIEKARNQMNALKYLVSNTVSERAEYADYKQAILFVKENLKEVVVGSNTYAQSLSFEDSSSGLITYTSVKTDAKELSKEEVSQFYLRDIHPDANLSVSASSAVINMETSDKKKYIKQSLNGDLRSYTNTLEIFVGTIDDARDLIHAIKFAQKNSEGGIRKFESMDETKEWLNQNPGEITMDSKHTRQNLIVTSTEGNKLELKVITASEGVSPVDETYEIYPEDLAMEDIAILISGKKVSVPLSTGKLKYIKSYKDGEIQNYSKTTEVLFDDVKTAKSFVEAIRFIYQNSKPEEDALAGTDNAFNFLVRTLGKVEVPGKIYDQKIEKAENNNCKLKYSLSETNSKLETIHQAYEFLLSDIDAHNSSIEILGKELKINLITREKEKLIKPFKEGEAANFTYNFDLYTDDILVAKKILEAFDVLAKECK